LAPALKFLTFAAHSIMSSFDRAQMSIIKRTERCRRLTLLLYLEFHEDPSIAFVTLYYHVMFAETAIS
jgi:hypothetical protein